MKLVLISDTHGLHDKLNLPSGDVLVHSGDLCNGGKLFEIRAACTWLNAQIGRFEHVIAIAGNHDFACEHFLNEDQEDLMRHDFFRDVHYLRDSAVTIDGVKFYGSPWTPEFCGWAFNLNRGPALRDKWALIPKETDVLVTHGPPMGIQDWVGRERVGCADLRVVVERIKPRLHAFGHIHGGYGEIKIGETRFVNASVVDERYRVVNAPVVVDLESEDTLKGRFVAPILAIEKEHYVR